MNFPPDFQSQCGFFAFVRARRWAKELEPIVGSPLETTFGCAFLTTVHELGLPILLATTEEQTADAPGYFIRPQAHLGPHRVDFLIGGKGLKSLIVECDGREFHHASREQIERDRRRDAELDALGYRVFRYPGTQIYNEVWYAAAEVFGALDPEAFRAWGLEFRDVLP